MVRFLAIVAQRSDSGTFVMGAVFSTSKTFCTSGIFCCRTMRFVITYVMPPRPEEADNTGCIISAHQLYVSFRNFKLASDVEGF